MRFFDFARQWTFRENLRRLGRELVEAGRCFFRADGPSWAACIAYYGLLSIFPLLIGLASLAAVFVDPHWAASRATGVLGDFLPRGTGVLDRVMGETLVAARKAGWLSLLPLLWSGSLVFNAITKALNIATEAPEHYGYLKRTFLRGAMLVSLMLLFGVALVGPLLMRFLRETLNFLPLVGDVLFATIVNAIPALVFFGALALAYRYVPSRAPAWRHAFEGAAVATLLFLAAKPLFLGYLKHLARYNVFYGSVAGIVVLQIWTWVVAMISLYGGHVTTRRGRLEAGIHDARPRAEAG